MDYNEKRNRIEKLLDYKMAAEILSSRSSALVFLTPVGSFIRITWD
jgi:hypothetical protein